MVQSLPCHNLSQREALTQLVQWTRESRPRQVHFLNAHCVNVAHRNPEYRRVLEQADLVLADGIGVKLAFRWEGSELRDNLNGTDLFPLLCQALNQQEGGARLFLLGGKPGVPEGVKAWIAARFPNLEVVGATHGYHPDKQVVVDQVCLAQPDLLLVAMGVPAQEIFIHQHLGELGCPLAMGVGGLFDFYSGRQRRAPQWMRRLNLEWAYRLWREPGRMWRRYILGNLLFLWRMVKTPRQE